MRTTDRVMILAFALLTILALLVYPPLYQTGYVILFGEIPGQYANLALLVLGCCMVLGVAAALWVRAERHR